MTKLEEVRQFAQKAHAGQLYDGKDYFLTHVLDVTMRVANDPRATEQHVMAALLHDVLEDCPVELIDLADLLGTDNYLVLDAVLRLTKNKGDSYQDYMAGLVHSSIATLVKFHDSSANFAYGGRKKYADNIAFLTTYLTPAE